MFEALMIGLIAALVVAVMIAAIAAGGSEGFLRKHPLVDAALKGLVFYSCLAGGHYLLQLFFPALRSNGFLIGALGGAVGGAVWTYRQAGKSAGGRLRESTE
jgi:hypothetical protein